MTTTKGDLVADSVPEARVASIYRFPVKSMQGEQVDRVEVGPLGVVGDRGYAVVDTADGKVASAKNPGKWRSLLACRATYSAEPVPGEPLPAAVITTPDGVEVRTDDPEVDRVLSELVGREVRLSSLPESSLLLEEVWPEIEGLAPEEFIQGTRVGNTEAGEVVSGIPIGLLGASGTFFDASPLHLLTTSTLAHLQSLEPAGTFDPRRYRPNFLVEMEDAGFVENDWVGSTVALGDEVVASVVIPTMRCVMTTLAQSDLPVDRGTLRAIARHNRIEIPDFGTWACAGVYATVQSPGPVAVGAEVRAGDG